MQRREAAACALRRGSGGCIRRRDNPLIVPLPVSGRARVSTQPQQDEGRLAGILRALVPALIIALVIRTMLFQAVSIPSGSMQRTLLIGDYLVVSKFTYGYSRYSLPFGPPLFSGRAFPSLPNRGDIIVFRSPIEENADLIKRTIGLPGDRIQVKGGILHINGTQVPRERSADFVGEDPCSPAPGSGVIARVPRWRETLPNGISYDTLDCPVTTSDPDPDNTPVYQVPAEHFFMIGDNRHRSLDSRFLHDVGYVPFENLIGRAQMVFLSVEEGENPWHVWRWPWSIRWTRLGTFVR
jgi:signal peptidase I